MLGLVIGETKFEPLDGRDKEVAQVTLMFHVEQLREIYKHVKACYVETGFGGNFLLYFSRATSRTEMAAGVTPDIREA